MKTRSLKTLGAVASLALIPVVAFAATTAPSPSTTPSSVLSDYATDVQAGQAQIAASPVALAVHQAVIDSESQQGQIDTSKVPVETKVDMHESTKADSQVKVEAPATPEQSATPDAKDPTKSTSGSDSSTGAKN